jgi:glycosyltransferase involved in cell wall biosynthesis
VFSICLPVWDGAHLAEIAIGGVLAQTEQDWELVVGDNASTDGLADLVARYDDARIRYHRFEDHVGTEESFNRTMRLAGGRWVIPIGADDRLHPRALEVMKDAATREATVGPGRRPVGMVLTACRRVLPDGTSGEALYYGSQRVPTVRAGRYDATRWLRLAAGGGPFPWNFGSAAFSRQLLERTDALRADIGLAADTELIFRVAAFGDVVYVDEPLLDFMVRPDSDGNERWAANRRQESATPLARALLSALEAHASERPVTAADWDAIVRAAAYSHLRRAAQHRVLPSGRGRSGALGDVVRAIHLRPRVVLARDGALMAAGALLAPTWLLRRVSVSLRSRTHGADTAPRPNVPAGRSLP